MSPRSVYLKSMAAVLSQSFPCSSKTSSSSSSMTPSTTLKLFMNPLTATRSILFVVALYSVLKTVSAVECSEVTVEKDRQTKGDNSLSIRRARRAIEARREVGRGMSIVLW